MHCARPCLPFQAPEKLGYLIMLLILLLNRNCSAALVSSNMALVGQSEHRRKAQKVKCVLGIWGGVLT